MVPTPMVNPQPRLVPRNLRQSGQSNARALIYTRLRKSPYWHLSEQAGCYAYSTYNHMYHPRAYIPMEEGGLLKEYEYLTQHVTLWNVAVERQIQVKGPDAARFVNYVITRDVNKIFPEGQVDRARYVILCNQHGGIINDPVLLRLEEDEFWFSISDSDVLLWLQGINVESTFDVHIHEIDVAPVQIQGPKSVNLMTKLFGERILQIPYYGLWQTRFNGMDVVISRTGFSTELGYEMYLRDATEHAEKLWNTLLEAGEEFSLRVIAPSHIRRLEAGILSYGQDMDIENNPFEVRLGWQVDLEKDAFVGKDALTRIKEKGVKQKLVGLRMGGDPLTWYNADFYPVLTPDDETPVGYVTSAFYSPYCGTNIAFAFVPVHLAGHDTELKVKLPGEAEAVSATVSAVPFAPKKALQDLDPAAADAVPGATAVTGEEVAAGAPS